jgi:glutathione synthase/RimK-type ligase-like ATP-grasp enzyme
MASIAVRLDDAQLQASLDQTAPLLVVGRKQDKKAFEDVTTKLRVRLLSAREYLSKPEETGNARQIFNLCAVDEYLSQGYYVSLLAEARGQRAVPSIDTVTGLAWKYLYKNHLAELSRLIAGKVPEGFPEDGKASFAIEIFFGEPNLAWAKRLAARAFRLFPAPILEVKVKRQKGEWRVEYIWPMSSATIAPESLGRFKVCLSDYLNNRRNPSLRRRRAMFDLAILFDPAEKFPPSDEPAIRQFIRAAERQNIQAETISKRDLGRLSSFDALFIRETTNIDNHTFTFARQAEERGMPVIDDSVSILRCSNKVYLREALARARIATPRTLLVTKTTMREVLAQLTFPCVLKIPDGSFSRGVVKAKNGDEFLEQAAKMLEESFIILAQEYLYTEHDWRIGVLDGQPLFACKYHMARGHWQVYKHGTGGTSRWGKTETLAIDAAPPAIVRAAVKSSLQMGRGLYGVDLKEVSGVPHVIEVNDNPNIDGGYEDKELGDQLYDAVISLFRKRILIARGLAEQSGKAVG